MINDTTGSDLFLKASKNNMKQWDIQEGDIVRIRSIVAVKGTSNYIELTKSSHFLKFKKDSLVCKTLEHKMKDNQVIFKMMNKTVDDVILEHPITISRTCERYSSLDFVSLKELFHDPDSKYYAFNYLNYFDEYNNPLQSRYFRMRFNVLRVDPKKIEEFVQLY